MAIESVSQGLQTLQSLPGLQVRRKVLFQWIEYIVPLGLLALAAAIRIHAGGLSVDLQNTVFDEYQRRRPRVWEDAGVRVIDIDDESLKRLGQWPWPRTLLAKFVDKTTQAGVAALAFDAVFSEPDRTSPALVADAVSDADLKRRLKSLPDNDAVFARAIKRGRVVLGFPLVAEDNGAVPETKFSVAVKGEGTPHRYLPNYPGAVPNLKVFEAAAAGNGSFSFVPDRDAMVRGAQLMFAQKHRLIPSLSLEALRVAQGARNIMIKTSAGESRDLNRKEFEELDISKIDEVGRETYHTGIASFKVGASSIPVDMHGRMWVYFTADEDSRTIPAWQIFEKSFDPSRLEGCIAFVGTSAQGLKDLRATPLNPTAPGVMVHANAAEQAILQKFLVRPDYADGLELLFMLAVGVLLTLLLPRVGALWTGGVAAVIIGLGLKGSWWAFSKGGMLFDPIYPAATAFVVYFSSSVVTYIKTELERRQVKTAMGRYMSPALVAQLADHPEKLTLGGETREMTFHFCDIRGFTTISEQLEPKELTHFINSFLTPMTDIILAHQGVIDKYMGDCIMAFWNAPLDDAEHARHACQAALAMHSRLRELNERWEAEAKQAGRRYLPIHIGTGLNTGTCIVGNMGSDQRFDYSVLGDDVNLASRLEGQSKTYGVDIVVGPRTRELAPEFAYVELDLIRVKGKTKPVTIYALVGPPELARREDFQKFLLGHAQALEAYRARRWDQALELMEAWRTGPVPLEKLHHLYEERIRTYLAAAPEKDWDGSFTATSK